MIVFNLICPDAHTFEGWFASTADFDRQRKSSLLSCPVCGSNDISKGLHAPYVNTGSAQQRSKKAAVRRQDDARQYATFAKEVTQFVEKLISETEDVGDAFPEEARRIHYNEAPERKIRGNASSDEVSDLREEGIDVISVPVPLHRISKTH